MATPKQLKLPYTHAEWSAYKKNVGKKTGADLTTKVNFGPQLKKIEDLFGKIQWTELETTTGDKIDALCAKQLAPVREAVKKLIDDIKTEAVIPANIKKQIIPGFLADLINYEKAIKDHCEKLDAKIEKDLELINEGSLARLALAIKQLITEAEKLDKDRIDRITDNDTAALETDIKKRLKQMRVRRDNVGEAIHAFESSIRNLSKRIASAGTVQKHKFNLACTIHKSLRQDFERLNSKVLLLASKHLNDMAEYEKQSTAANKTMKMATNLMKDLEHSYEATKKESLSIIKSRELLSEKLKQLKKDDLKKLLTRLADRINMLKTRLITLGQQTGQLTVYLKTLKKERYNNQYEDFVKISLARTSRFNKATGEISADMDQETQLIQKMFKTKITLNQKEQAHMMGTK